MAITNHERVGKALDLLKAGLGPFVEREFTSAYQTKAPSQASLFLGEDRRLANKSVTQWDTAALLRLMWSAWNEVFRTTLGQSERTLVSELRDQRNKWAHQQTFSSDDTYRALDSAGRLLAAVSAPQADDVEKMKMELLRLRFDEQVRSEKRKSAGTAVESAVTGHLKPWREVVTPHKDVASGRYQQAEFAADLYRTQQQEFPPDCRETDYEKRIRAAYPIHPEIFDRLYTDWSTLIKFQRTRGVLRLMAAVIHCLWEKADRNPLIQPATIPIDDPRVQFELTRYLSDNWVPIIEKDVDGPNSLPWQLDGDVPNLGKFAASRRVARTIYLGSAPTPTAANRGLEDRRVKLGCVMPGESPAVFGDALRRLAAAATYLYQDGPRYWYSTQPTVTKLADDRAELLKRDPDTVGQEIDTRLRADLRQMGDFSRVHPLPGSSADVPDDLDARLVILGINHPYGKEPANAAETAAKAILETRGTSPRLYRNTLVFLAADMTRLQDLDEAVRKYLAWASILDETDTLDLTPNQVRQAETQKEAAEGAITARLPETYQWLLVPIQDKPQAGVEWQAIRLSGHDALAVRASKKLRTDELLLPVLAPARLRMELDRVPLWRGEHVAIKQLVDDFGRYLYLPRLKDSAVLLGAIRDGFALLTWEQDAFAYAESYDETAERYRGLRSGQTIAVTDTDTALLVRPEVARRQIDAETVPVQPVNETTDTATTTSPSLSKQTQPVAAPSDPVAPPRPKRYHGTVTLDPTRAGRDASKLADEVITHLVGLMGASVRVTLEIEADMPDGAPEHVIRTVTENGRTLKFTSQGFESE